MTKQEIINKINELKKEKQKYQFLAEAQSLSQLALKILLNSSYGALGSTFYPCYDLDNAEAVTLSAQAVTREMVRFTDDILNKLEKSSGNQYVIAR